MISLYLTENLSSALKEKLSDFFTKKDFAERISPLPVGIVAPNASAINGLKVQLSRLGLLIHVHFFTPSTLRQFLSPLLEGSKISCEKDIYLSTALTGMNKEEAIFWAPILETATKAGFSNALSEAKLLADQLKNRNEILLAAGLQHPIEHDRALWQETLLKLQKNHPLEPRFHHLFIAGFGYESTHLFPLFLQALTQSIDASVFLDATQDLPAQELLVHTWEKFLNQEATWITNSSDLPVSPKGIETTSFQETLSELYALLKNHETSCSRIAITSTCTKPLREAAAFLQTLAIPCSITLPIQDPNLPLFESWRRYQEDNTLQATLHFAQVLLNYQKIDLEEFTQLTHQLQRIAHTLQSNDLELLKQAVWNQDILSFFEDWPILAAAENISYWDEKMMEILEVFGKNVTESPLETWIDRSEIVSKPIILEYLSYHFQPTFENAHPWARIWIGPVDAMPFVDVGAAIYLCKETPRAPTYPQNDWAPSHNQEIIISFQKNSLEKFLHVPFGYILNEEEESFVQKRHLESLLKKNIPITFLGDLSLLPEDISDRLHPIDTAQSSSFYFENKLSLDEKLQLQKAHAARRTPHQPFGPYEFTFTPREPLCLSSSAWEEAFNYPALAFYKHILHLSPPQLSISKGASREKGIWVHRWLQEDFDDIETIALQFYSKHLSKKTPHQEQNILYQSLFEEAKAHALQIQTAFQNHFSNLYRYAEIELPKDISLELTSHPQKSLKMRGRIDALLTHTAIDKIENVDQPIYIIDFKTSSRKPLTKNNLQKGYGLQLLLYGLALRKIGATQVTLALVSPEGTTPLTIENWQDFDPLLEELLLISQGHFGDLAPHFENGSSNFHPTATLAIDPKILATKYRDAS